MDSPTYPADPAEAALRLFLQWLGTRYARSTRAGGLASPAEGVATGTITVGRQWPLAFALLNTLADGATVEFEAARAAVEHRLDAAGLSVALWVPPGGAIPAAEPGLSQIVRSVEQARPIEDGRLEVRRPVQLLLRRIDTAGSVITIGGGLAPHWAQFTNRVPGTFTLNSSDLLRLPASQEERDVLAERIISAAGQPEAGETQAIVAEDVWSANALGEGGSCVLGSPRPENDESSALLRRNLRKLLKAAEGVPASGAAATALILLGASAYAAKEKLSWAIRGMDPTLYSGYDFIVVIADGLVRPLLEPPAGTLPWDTPLA